MILLLLKKILQSIKKQTLKIRHNSIGRSCVVESNTFMRNCKIGNYNYIGRNCVMNDVIMGNYCSIAAAVQIGGMEHSWWAHSTSTYLSDECYLGKKTHIGNDVWIGASAIIRQGITIGDGAVIGGGAVVTHDVPPYAIAVGIPAKVIGYRCSPEFIERLEKIQWWNWPDEVLRENIDWLIHSDINEDTVSRMESISQNIL